MDIPYLCVSVLFAKLHCIPALRQFSFPQSALKMSAVDSVLKQFLENNLQEPLDCFTSSFYLKIKISPEEN